MNNNNNLKISIVTACLNSGKTIEATIRSVAIQEYSNIEYIVVDGISTDNTLEVIDNYSSKIDKIVSEKDSGIYDAMNKGIALATGDIIGFLHADDVYADEHTLCRVAEAFGDAGIDSCYGDLVYVAADNMQRVVRRWRAGNFNRKKMYRGWMPPHPTFFARRDCYLHNGGYRTDMGSSADYELMLRYILCNNITVKYIQHTLVLMRTGGISNASLRNRINAHAMDWKAWRVNGLLPHPWSLPCKPLRKLLQWRCKGHVVC